jgi:hypothetical protein
MPAGTAELAQGLRTHQNLVFGHLMVLYWVYTNCRILFMML